MAILLVAPGLLCLASAARAQSPSVRISGNVVVVCAARELPDGKTIAPTDIVTKYVAASTLPEGVAPGSAFGKSSTYFAQRKSDVVGRLSKGIHKGQILFYSFPGFRGPSTVVALLDIPAGSEISGTDVEEREMNPCDIPTYACATRDDTVGCTSTGIARGQVVVRAERGPAGKRRRGGLMPGPDSNHFSFDEVSARKFIPAGALLDMSNVRHATVHLNHWLSGPPANLELHPEGQKAKLPIEPGQVITTDIVAP
ncbi:MAG: hypothetical protein KGS72_15760 [Cyanobacteria bacterium REEB67]|nr:hypothetical protein [Cyanobacteria bacterium REEB67]